MVDSWTSHRYVSSVHLIFAWALLFLFSFLFPLFLNYALKRVLVINPNSLYSFSDI